jgi:AcrR family transcriptional regulator
VQEVCGRADISRRTFFNYFPTKEDAITGHADDDIPTDVIEEFIERGASSPPGEISPTLFQDLVRLSLRLSEGMSGSEEDTRQLIGVIKKEPQLILRITGITEQREAQFARDADHCLRRHAHHGGPRRGRRRRGSRAPCRRVDQARRKFFYCRRTARRAGQGQP